MTNIHTVEWEDSVKATPQKEAVAAKEEAAAEGVKQPDFSEGSKKEDLLSKQLEVQTLMTA